MNLAEEFRHAAPCLSFHIFIKSQCQASSLLHVMEGQKDAFPWAWRKYKHIWKEATAEQTKLPSECGQEGVSINNHKSVKRFFPLGLPLRKVDGNWGYRDMPVLLLLEPGVVIYKNVTFPSLPPHLCQRLGDQQVSIYCCPGAHSNEPPVHPTAYKQDLGSCSGWELLPLWKFGKRERITDFLLSRQREVTWPPSNHITNHQVNKIWSSHVAQLIVGK